MQTFITQSGFAATAQQLDRKRLGKQRVEALQILNALSGKSKGWVNHPATLMWHGHEEALRFYHDCMVAEWLNRGYKNTMPFLCTMEDPYGSGFRISRTFIPNELYPHWWRDKDTLEKVIASHRSNLMRKDPSYYGKYFPGHPDNLPYFWPVTKAEVETKKVLALCT